MLVCLEDLFVLFAAVSPAITCFVTYQTRHIIATSTLYWPTPNRLSGRLEAKKEVNVHDIINYPQFNPMIVDSVIFMHLSQ